MHLLATWCKCSLLFEGCQAEPLRDASTTDHSEALQTLVTMRAWMPFKPFVSAVKEVPGPRAVPRRHGEGSAPAQPWISLCEEDSCKRRQARHGFRRGPGRLKPGLEGLSAGRDLDLWQRASERRSVAYAAPSVNLTSVFEALCPKLCTGQGPNIASMAHP